LEVCLIFKQQFLIILVFGRINALVDFHEPLEIIKHLMVGSEGTLGFVSRVTYNTVADYKDKASAFVVFENVEDAAHATHLLREAKCTDAVELMDRPSLRTCEKMEYLQFLQGQPDEASALLIECRGASKESLQVRGAHVLLVR
jgi:D-lactate dehydrogenase